MKLRSASTPAVSTDLRVITVRLVSGTCGGARVGVVQALAGCGERCGVRMRVYRSCAISARKAGLSRQKLAKCSICLQFNGCAGFSAGC